MNYGFQYFCKVVFCVFVSLSLGYGCQPTDSPISPARVTKTQRTQLGKAIRTVVMTDTVRYWVLPKDYPQYGATYAYLQELYNQAYYFLRDDWTAPTSDQWDVNRTWEVCILRSDEKMAFCLPGGDFYITTAFLKSLDYEYELYYIMTFEAIIMHHKYLLNQLISYANNTGDLIELANGEGVSSTNISIEYLTDKLVHEIAYTNTGAVQEIDQKTSDLICDASFFDRFAILHILSKLDSNDDWLSMRPSYTGRTQFIVNELDVENPSNCGNNKWSNLSTDYTYMINNLP